MIVSVVDRQASNRLWGTPRYTLIIVKVEIADHCPVCGEKRGEPYSERFCENEEWFTVDRWHNPCGHTDMYVDVLAEAASLSRAKLKVEDV